MQSVFVVLHSRKTEAGGEDIKMIGVYSSRERAEASTVKLIKQPGFGDFPDGFSIDEYQIDKDHWQDGFGGSEVIGT